MKAGALRLFLEKTVEECSELFIFVLYHRLTSLLNICLLCRSVLVSRVHLKCYFHNTAEAVFTAS